MEAVSVPTAEAASRESPRHRLAAFVAGLRAERVFLALAIPFGLLLLALTPPFQVPDEPAHFLRAYAISEGQLFAEPLPPEAGGGSGNILPVSLRLSATRLTGNIPFHPEVRADPSTIIEELARPLEPDNRAPTAFTGASVYFPIVYAPQALGMWLARALGGSPLWILYGGRLLNLVVALALTAWAIRVAPVHRWSMALVALTPLVVFTRSSVSADGLTTALAFLLVALVLREALVKEGAITWGPLALIALLGALLGLCKLTYFLMSAAVLLIPASRFGSRGRAAYLLRSAVVIAASAAPAFLWGRHVSGLYRPDTQPAPNPPEQLAWVLAHPARSLRIWLEAPFDKAQWYLETGLGRLGWQDTPLPLPVITTLALLLVAVAVLDSGSDAARARPLSALQRLLAALVAVTVTYAVVATLYIAWNPVGAATVEGVQGRYFLPLLPLFLVVLHRSAAPSALLARARSAILGFAALLSLGATSVAIGVRYFG